MESLKQRLFAPNLLSERMVSEWKKCQVELSYGFTGAHSWVRKAFNIEMEGEQTDYIWGVVDLTPDTDFPDVRNKSAVHSNSGSCMIIPREGDKIRLYIQLDGKSSYVTNNGRIDKARLQPRNIFEVGLH